MVHQPLSAGEEYDLSVWLKADKPAEVELYLAAVPAVKGLRHHGIRERKTVGPSWQRHHVSLRINDDTKYTTLRCVVQLPTPGVVLSIDDALLSETGGKRVRTVTSAVIGCVRTKAPPSIDGKLDDPCWQRAGKAEGFLRLRLRPGGERRHAEEQTSVLLLHDDENLYLGFRCLESRMDSRTQRVTKRDGPVWNDDCVEIFLAPEVSDVLSAFPLVAEYFHLVVNVAGVQADAIGVHGGWDGRWEVKTARGKAEWRAEVKIPFTELGVYPREGEFWRGNFCRAEPRLGEFSSWSPLEEGFHEPDHFGKIGFARSGAVAKLLEEEARKRGGDEIRERYLSEAAAALERAQQALKRVSGRSPDSVEELTSGLQGLTRDLRQFEEEIKAAPPEALIRKQDLTRQESAWIRQRCTFLCNRAWAGGFSGHGHEGANGVYAAFRVKAITDRRILPYSDVGDRRPLKELSMAACPGEHEPASFVVVGSKDISRLKVTVSPLRCGSRVLPADTVDRKVVKCWYQSSDRKLWEVGYLKPKGKVLVPELLLNDDTLVTVDLEEETMAVRVLDPETQQPSYLDITGPGKEFEQVYYGQIKDATALRPVDIPAGHCRQFWLTVRVPDDTEPGEYTGRVTLSAQNAPGLAFPLRIRVYPFRLEGSVIENAIYTEHRMGREIMLKTGYINKKKGNPFNHYWDRHHMRMGLVNMREHGIDAPLFPQLPFGERSITTEQVRSLIDDYMGLLKETGYPLDRFFYYSQISNWTYPGLEYPFGNYWRANKRDAEQRFKWVSGVRPRAAVHLNYSDTILSVLLDLKARADKHGFREFWFYFADEVMRNELPEIYPYLREYRKAGLKTFCTTAKVFFIDAEGKVDNEFWQETAASLDGITFPMKLNPALAAMAREAGVRAYSYNNPQMGVELPHTYRRNYGLALWCAGYTGGMDFCYTSCGWNDFESKEYRKHNMVYPSADRMIDTLQWEGYREGVDDQRYLTTLLKAIETAKEGGWLARRRARKAEKWVKSIEVEDTLGWDGFEEGVDDMDLDGLRRQIAAWIMRLSG